MQHGIFATYQLEIKGIKKEVLINSFTNEIGHVTVYEMAFDALSTKFWIIREETIKVIPYLLIVIIFEIGIEVIYGPDP